MNLRTQWFMACSDNSARIWSTPFNVHHFNFSIEIWTSEEQSIGTNGCTVCIAVCLTSEPHAHLIVGLINFPPTENIVGICTLITKLVPGWQTYVKVCKIFIFTLCFKVINLVFQAFPFFVPENSARYMSYFFIVSAFILLGFCNHCSLARLLESNNFQHSL